MGSSAKKKKEKQKDFQKTKLKVGKTRPKNTNATSTSFQAKSITLNKQSLSASAPSANAQFSHSLSLLSSKPDTQRKEALASVLNALSDVRVERNRKSASTEKDDANEQPSLPRPASEIISSLRPLLLDASRSIRTSTLTAIQLLPDPDVRRNIDLLVIYMHIALTHLSSDIRTYAIDILVWLTEVTGEELVSCRGGWSGTLRRVVGVLGWNTAPTTEVHGAHGQSVAGQDTQKGWSSVPRTKLEDTKLRARQIMALSMLLKAGLSHPATEHLVARRKQQIVKCWPIQDYSIHMLGNKGDPYAHLGLFDDVAADKQDQGSHEDASFGDWVARLDIFREVYQAGIVKGVFEGKREGGEIGRAASAVDKILAPLANGITQEARL